MKLRKATTSFFMGVLISLFWWGAVGAQEGIEKRFENVETLIEKSSASQRIDVSGNEAALAKKAEARSLFQEAKAAQSSGDTARANELLGKASQLMFMGVKEAKPTDLDDAKNKRDFDNRATSVQALLDAHKRVSDEKKVGADGEKVRGEVTALIGQARALYDEQKIPDGRKLLDQAYVMLKESIEQMRGGDTLVRDLNFASKEEEYHYEIDRNDTHQMLVKVLLKDKDLSGGRGERVEKFIEDSKGLRKQAEEEASNGDYDKAVTTLENSTKALVRAIRIAGVYIPG